MPGKSERGDRLSGYDGCKTHFEHDGQEYDEKDSETKREENNSGDKSQLDSRDPNHKLIKQIQALVCLTDSISSQDTLGTRSDCYALCFDVIRNIGPRQIAPYIRALCHVYCKWLRTNTTSLSSTVRNRPNNLVVHNVPQDNWKKTFLSQRKRRNVQETQGFCIPPFIGDLRVAISFIRSVALPFTCREPGSLATDDFRRLLLRVFYISRSTTKAIVVMCKRVIHSWVALEHERHILSPATAIALMVIGEVILHELNCGAEIEAHLGSCAMRTLFLSRLVHDNEQFDMLWLLKAFALFIQNWSTLGTDKHRLPLLFRSVVENMFYRVQVHLPGSPRNSVWHNEELRKSIRLLRGAIYSFKSFRLHILKPMMKALSQVQNFTIHEHLTLVAFSFVVEDREVWRAFREKGKSIYRLLTGIALNLMKEALKKLSNIQSSQNSESLSFIRYVSRVVHKLLKERDVYLSYIQSEELIHDTHNVLPDFIRSVCEYLVNLYNNEEKFELSLSAEKIDEVLEDVARIIRRARVQVTTVGGKDLLFLAYNNKNSRYLRKVLQSLWLVRRFLSEAKSSFVIHNSDIFIIESRRLEQYLKQRVHLRRMKSQERKKNSDTRALTLRSVLPEKVVENPQFRKSGNESSDDSMTKKYSPASFASPVIEEKLTLSAPHLNRI